MKKFAVLLLATLIVSGCGGTQKFLPIIDASLHGAKGISEAGKILAEADKNVAGCYVTSAFLTAIDSAQGAVNGWAKGDGSGIIPAIDVDISACLILQDASMKPLLADDAKIMVDALSAGILPAIESIVLSIMEGKDATCQEKIIAKAAFGYVSAVKGPLIEELAAPDGKISIPEVALDACP